MRILKRYPNRRIYDTSESCYITINDIREMVLSDEKFQVLDSKTGEDRTRAVLLQIIADMENEGHESVLTNNVLEELIRLYGDSMSGLLGTYIEQGITTFLSQQSAARKQVKQVLAGTGNPFFTTDTAAALRAAEIHADIVMKATQVDGVYNADPSKDTDAVRYEELSFGEALQRDLRFMDQTAIALCRENDLPIMVFDMGVRGNILKAVRGEKVGTIVREDAVS